MTFITNNNGAANLVINIPRIYQVFTEKSGYIRSNQLKLSVGKGIGKDVALKVEIISPLIPEIAFSLSKNQIDFGKLLPDAQASDQILITNEGNVRIYLEGIVKGDQIFKGNLTLDNLTWPDFSTIINVGSEKKKNVLVGLSIPKDWKVFGIKEGNLTF